MFALLDQYYLHASRDQFETDLEEKEWVLLANETAGDRVCGFTTLMRLHAIVDGALVRAFFSGDTVAESTYWAHNETARAIGLLLQHMLEVAEDDVESRWFWFVISSTYRSYRLLPMIFRESHPSPHCATPPHTTRTLEALTRQKFGGGYDPQSSVVRFPHATVFRSGYDVGSGGRADLWKDFFLRANPGRREGDRLASLAALSTDNLTSLGRRLLGQSAVDAVPRTPPAGVRQDMRTPSLAISATRLV
jgi:hypothetical protein